MCFSSKWGPGEMVPMINMGYTVAFLLWRRDIRREYFRRRNCWREYFLARLFLGQKFLREYFSAQKFLAQKFLARLFFGAGIFFSKIPEI